MSKIISTPQTGTLTAKSPFFGGGEGASDQDALLFAALFSMLQIPEDKETKTDMDTVLLTDSAEAQSGDSEENPDQQLAALLAALTTDNQQKLQLGTGADTANPSGPKDILQQQLAHDLKPPVPSQPFNQRMMADKPVLVDQMPVSTLIASTDRPVQNTEVPKSLIGPSAEHVEKAVILKGAEDVGQGADPIRHIPKIHRQAKQASHAQLAENPDNLSEQMKEISSSLQLKNERNSDGLPLARKEIMPVAVTEERAPSLTGRSAGGSEASVLIQNQSQPGLNNHSGGQNNGQNYNGAGTASPQDMNEHWIDMLDMQDDKWSETLVRRVEREFRAGGKGLEMEMSPRHLGRLRVTLSQQNEQTHIHMRTETSSAAQLLNEAESRLAQMLETSGLKLGQFSAHTNHNGMGGGQRDSQNSAANSQQNKKEDAIEPDNGAMAEAMSKKDESIVNIQA